jgi:peptide chain release factor 3
MDRAHRDRVAFVRICSGRFQRGMKVRHVRTGRDLRLANPTQFVAQERSIIEEAFAGDVIGVYDPGVFEIGDTLTDGADLKFEGIPSFAPEHFARLTMMDPLRRKQLAKGIEQLAQEGTIQLYRPPAGRAGDVVLGAVGPLQLEVVKYRLKAEYDVEVRLESIPYSYARWVTRKEGGEVDMDALQRAAVGIPVVDVRERPVLLFQSEWHMQTAQKYLPDDYVLGETAHGVVVRA